MSYYTFDTNGSTNNQLLFNKAMNPTLVNYHFVIHFGLSKKDTSTIFITEVKIQKIK
jgi:hypothetical protein